MQRRFKNKNILITGCNRGIGKAIFDSFVNEGANIIACTRKVTKEMCEYYDQIEREHCIKIYPIQIDLSDGNSVQQAIEEIFALKISINSLVNNAGISCFDGLTKVCVKNLNDVFFTNYFSPILLIKGLLMPLMKANGATIINMASVAGIDGTPGNCVYGASKAALILATKSLSKELSKAKIRVNAVAPNIVSTDMTSSISAEFIKEQISNTPIGRVSTPEEIANVVLFLSSNESSYINGQVIRIDGGLK